MSSSELAISVRGLGKAYTIEHKDRQPSTLAELALQWLRQPFRQLATERFWALQDVSFEVSRGEVLGIIGRNGAGKSTLLKVLSRITEPTTGVIDLYGRTGSLLEVGTGFHRELTGRENIYLNGNVLGMTRAEIDRRFDEIVEFAGTERFLDTPVKRYSSGMYVRLAFAVAAHLNPEILIVDEVLAVGDAEFQKKCLGKMGEVARGGRTVLFVSHNMAAVRSLCTRAILLQDGRIAREATPEECVTTYLRLYQPARDSAVIRLERPPDATAWITAARLYCGGEISSQLEMGEELAIEVDFEAESDIQPALGIVFFNADRLAVLHFSTRYAPSAALSEPRRRGTLRCDFGTIPFTGGEFEISLFFGGPIDDSHVAESCLAFEVLERDLFQAGRAYDSSHSLMWWPAKLSVRESEVVVS